VSHSVINLELISSLWLDSIFNIVTDYADMCPYVPTITILYRMSLNVEIDMWQSYDELCLCRLLFNTNSSQSGREYLLLKTDWLAVRSH